MDVTVVTETRLTQSIDNRELDVQDFTLVRTNRTQKRKGGVPLFLNYTILFAVIDNISQERNVQLS